MTIQRLHQTAAEVAAGLDPACRQRVAPLLAQLVHDLNNPIGTFTLELYTLRSVLEDLDASPGPDGLEEERETLRDLQQNLDAALAQTAAIVQVVRDLATAWREP